MAQASDYAARMVAAMALTEPTLDTGIGSVTRKIFDAVAEVAASVSNEQYLLNYTFDVNSKSGADLDDFLLMFGFIRFPARRATGIVTFSRSVAATQDVPISQGTSVITGSLPTITFQTTAPAYLLAGTTSVQVPIQCVLAGSLGNVTANSITTLTSGIGGILPTPTNPSPTSGGTPPESDAAFRDRFKKTVLRSLAGTRDQFASLALQNNSGTAATGTIVQSTAVNVFGASSRWKEQAQIVGGAATSSIPIGNVKYIFPNSAVVGTDIANGIIYTPGVHYTFNATVNPPTITVLNGSIPEGTFVDLDFEYCSQASRNDPANGITNRVDVWVGGQRLLPASETTYFSTTNAFTSTPGPFLTSNYVRLDSDNTSPTAGHIFTPLAFGPIVGFPNSLVIGGVTYTRKTDFWVVHDKTSFGYGPTSSFGIEWNRNPTAGAAILLTGNNTYTYNAVPSDVENQVTTQKLVTTDVRAHQGVPVYLRFNFAVMADYGADRTALAAAIKSDLAVWLDSKGFSSSLQVSDLLQEAHGVRGVDNVRLLTSTEPTAGGGYGIERTSSLGVNLSNFVNSSGRATDVAFADNEVPVLFDVVCVFKAANSFGAS
jgi:hypothetical protein